MKKRFQHIGDIASAINAVFSDARSFRLTQEALLARLQPITDELETRTPAGARRYSTFEAAFAVGYRHARHDDIWKELEFCYRDSAGVLFSTHRESTHRKTEEYYAADRGAELGNMEGTHVWRVTDKPFGPWKVVGK